MARHLIYKQKVTLHLLKKDEAYALQDRVSRLLQNGLMDNLEDILDAAFPIDKVVRIDKLQLDLGNIRLQNFESEFKTQFISALTKSLAAKKESLSGAKGEEAIFSKAQSVENALIFFLEKGYLPWYSQAGKKVDWEEEILTYLNTAEYKHFFNWLKTNYQDRPVIIDRLVQQFSNKFIAELLFKMAPIFDDSWELIFADYLFIIGGLDRPETAARDDKKHAVGEEPLKENLSKDDPSKGKSSNENSSKTNTYNFAISRLAARDQIWKTAVRVLLAADGEAPAFEILKALFNYWGVKSRYIYADKESSINEGLKTEAVRLAFKNLIAQLRMDEGYTDAESRSSLHKKNEQAEPASDDTVDTNDSSLKIDDSIPSPKDNNPDDYNILKKDSNPGDAAATKNSAKDQAKKGVSVTKKDGTNEGNIISVNNSGIVMLHPFLKSFFEGLELLTGGKFKNDDARARAVLLLHYIATGETEAAEFDLTLQKILCGQPMENTLPSSIELTDQEATETANLLRSVLSHWEPLKNTSIDGFRGAFLQRNGNLELKDSGWLLTVEQKTIDILLGKLPWGFSTIRLPWMQELLSVDWY
ncbi:hypothetical protein KXD93_08305 [Mucilaginibacter sp. BJC16-A38]|uniref:contractile injection system tape measure protein n=1 Tax=Mucilaginibacter phenanthrenivorans TaxID=1234842 RepID=UPI00215790B4|nr:contractile injection system tape measure protein [Mucilaginibacter phenanthrenivorans]MCR8557641.1 hypothetical protein [Mucilaginibacter phenanthrenivorans]